VHDEQPRRKVRVDLQELRFAIEDTSYEHRYFLDTETGDVILASEMFDDVTTFQPARPALMWSSEANLRAM